MDTDTEMPDYFSDEELHESCEEIIECLMKYGGLSESAARDMVDAAEFCSVEQNVTVLDRLMFFHEVPYYWAMHLLHHETNPRWFHDPALWPRPKDQ